MEKLKKIGIIVFVSIFVFSFHVIPVSSQAVPLGGGYTRVDPQVLHCYRISADPANVPGTLIVNQPILKTEEINHPLGCDGFEMYAVDIDEGQVEPQSSISSPILAVVDRLLKIRNKEGNSGGSVAFSMSGSEDDLPPSAAEEDDDHGFVRGRFAIMFKGVGTSENLETSGGTDDAQNISPVSTGEFEPLSRGSSRKGSDVELSTTSSTVETSSYTTDVYGIDNEPLEDIVILMEDEPIIIGDPDPEEYPANTPAAILSIYNQFSAHDVVERSIADLVIHHGSVAPAVLDQIIMAVRNLDDVQYEESDVDVVINPVGLMRKASLDENCDPSEFDDPLGIINDGSGSCMFANVPQGFSSQDFAYLESLKATHAEMQLSSSSVSAVDEPIVIFLVGTGVMPFVVNGQLEIDNDNIFYNPAALNEDHDGDGLPTDANGNGVITAAEVFDDCNIGPGEDDPDGDGYYTFADVPLSICNDPAILDEKIIGFDYKHLDELPSQRVGGGGPPEDTLDDFHGTWMAHMLAAVKGNATGVPGLISGHSNIKIAPIQIAVNDVEDDVIDEGYLGSMEDFLAFLMDVHDGKYGSVGHFIILPEGNSYPSEETDAEIEHTIVNRMLDIFPDLVVVSPMGNQGIPVSGSFAGGAAQVAATSTNFDGDLTWYSNLGDHTEPMTIPDDHNAISVMGTFNAGLKGPNEPPCDPSVLQNDPDVGENGAVGDYDLACLPENNVSFPYQMKQGTSASAALIVGGMALSTNAAITAGATSWNRGFKLATLRFAVGETNHNFRGPGQGHGPLHIQNLVEASQLLSSDLFSDGVLDHFESSPAIMEVELDHDAPDGLGFNTYGVARITRLGALTVMPPNGACTCIDDGDSWCSPLDDGDTISCPDGDPMLIELVVKTFQDLINDADPDYNGPPTGSSIFSTQLPSMYYANHWRMNLGELYGNFPIIVPYIAFLNGNLGCDPNDLNAGAGIVKDELQCPASFEWHFNPVEGSPNIDADNPLILPEIISNQVKKHLKSLEDFQ